MLSSILFQNNIFQNGSFFGWLCWLILVFIVLGRRDVATHWQICHFSAVAAKNLKPPARSQHVAFQRQNFLNWCTFNQPQPKPDLSRYFEHSLNCRDFRKHGCSWYSWRDSSSFKRNKINRVYVRVWMGMGQVLGTLGTPKTKMKKTSFGPSNCCIRRVRCPGFPHLALECRIFGREINW